MNGLEKERKFVRANDDSLRSQLLRRPHLVHVERARQAERMVVARGEKAVTQSNGILLPERCVLGPSRDIKTPVDTSRNGE